MSNEQKGFVVYGDVKPVVDRLSDEEAGQLLRGMLDYFVDGKEPKFKGVLEFVFIPIKQQMDRNAEKYEAKCEKMRANANKRWQKENESKSIQLHANDANTKTNTNKDTKTKKEKETNTMPRESGEPLSLSEKIISYLNEKTGSRYPIDSKTATGKIYALADEGYTEADMKTVIDKKCADWLYDDNMREQLRPSTLFGAKFEEYLNAPISLKMEKEQKRTDTREDLKRQLAEKNDALAVIRDSIESMKDEEGRVRENIQEYRLLKDQAAILEDTIGQIEKKLRAN